MLYLEKIYGYYIWIYGYGLCLMLGENTCYLYICYDMFSAGGVFVHTACHHQKGGEFGTYSLMIIDFNDTATTEIYTE